LTAGAIRWDTALVRGAVQGGAYEPPLMTARLLAIGVSRLARRSSKLSAPGKTRDAVRGI